LSTASSVDRMHWSHIHTHKKNTDTLLSSSPCLGPACHKNSWY